MAFRVVQCQIGDLKQFSIEEKWTPYLTTALHYNRSFKLFISIFSCDVCSVTGNLIITYGSLIAVFEFHNLLDLVFTVCGESVTM